jgi:hypothetical protein
MKKCPNCQKEFPDSMRFCQTDGTPLGDSVEESQPEDPLKTTVVRQEDIASAIPPTDPFKTMVASSSNKDESGDLLQLPEQDFDPLKTMVATPIGQQNKPILEDPKPETPKFEDIREEIKSDSSPAFGGFSQPSEPLPEAPKDYSNDPTVLQPEPPKFNEPNLNPPTFGDSTPKKEEDDLPQTVMQNPWDNSPKSGQLPYSGDSPYSNDSPFAKPGDLPMSSPFDTPKSSNEEQKSSFEQPQSPFDSPFNAPNESSYNQPQSSFDNQQQSGLGDHQQSSFDNQPSSFEPQKPAFEEPPATQFGGAQFDQMNQGFGGANQQMQQQNDWNPPSPPEQGWGAQGLGANTPFQPPVVGAGKSQTLAIVSLILGGLGILSLLPSLFVIFCAVLPFLFGVGAAITGFLARSRAKQNPEQYGGEGLAMGGLVTGVLSILGTIGLVIIMIVYFAAIFS